MAISLYDLSVGSYLQITPAVEGFLQKGREHLEAAGTDPDEFIRTRLYPDMLPFSFQINSVCHHSLGAIRGVEQGEFSPPPRLETDYAGLQQLVADTRNDLQALSPETVNALAGCDMQFRAGDFTLPFVAENFLMSFSLPNFYFHATTAYDILRTNGVPLGKRDFTGRLRISR